MSRTNKGGVRLRVITGLTAAMAIAAGIYAATLRPLVPACDIVPTSIYGSKSFDVSCTGLSGLGIKYRMVPSSGPASSNSNEVVADGSGNVTLTATSDASGSTANVQMKLQSQDPFTLAWSDVSGPILTDATPAYYLAFSGTSSSVQHGNNAQIAVQNLSGNTSYKFGEVNSSGVATSTFLSTTAGGAGTGSAGSPLRGDTSSPYLTPSVAASSGSIAGSAGNVLTFSSPTGSMYVGIYDTNGWLIGVTPSITVTN